MTKVKYLTRKTLARSTGAQYYIISYLHDCGRLPVVRASKGKGYPILYDHKAIEIVKEHLNKQSR